MIPHRRPHRRGHSADVAWASLVAETCFLLLTTSLSMSRAPGTMSTVRSSTSSWTGHTSGGRFRSGTGLAQGGTEADVIGFVVSRRAVAPDGTTPRRAEQYARGMVSSLKCCSTALRLDPARAAAQGKLRLRSPRCERLALSVISHMSPACVLMARRRSSPSAWASETEPRPSLRRIRSGSLSLRMGVFDGLQHGFRAFDCMCQARLRVGPQRDLRSHCGRG